MTFNDAVKAHEKYLAKREIKEDAEKRILEFLDWDEADDDSFAQDVEIILASAEFSKELTTAVLWLNERELNLTCVRLRPYKDGEKVLLDVQQVIPIREAEEYQIKIRQKQAEERVARRKPKDYTKFDVTIDGATDERLSKRNTIFKIVKALCDRGVDPNEIATVSEVGGRMFFVIDSTVDTAGFLAAATALGGFDSARFNCGDGELISYEERTYALTNQWGGNTGKAVENILKAFPDKMVSCRIHAKFDWDEASFMREAKSKTGAEGVAEIRNTLEFARSLGAEIRWPKNSNKAYFWPFLIGESRNCGLFRMFDNGNVLIQLLVISSTKAMKLPKVIELFEKIPGVRFENSSDKTYAKISHQEMLNSNTKSAFRDAFVLIASKYKELQ